MLDFVTDYRTILIVFLAIPLPLLIRMREKGNDCEKRADLFWLMLYIFTQAVLVLAFVKSMSILMTHRTSTDPVMIGALTEVVIWGVVMMALFMLATWCFALFMVVEDAARRRRLG